MMDDIPENDQNKQKDQLAFLTTATILKIWIRV